jgi:hypothetical protein
MWHTGTGCGMVAAHVVEVSSHLSHMQGFAVTEYAQIRIVKAVTPIYSIFKPTESTQISKTTRVHLSCLCMLVPCAQIFHSLQTDTLTQGRLYGIESRE